MEELPQLLIVVGILFGLFWLFMRVITHESESEKAFKKLKKEFNLSLKEDRKLMRMNLADKSEEEMREKLQEMRNRSDDESESLADRHTSLLSAFKEEWDTATGNPNSEIVQEELQSQKRVLQKRMPNEKNGTERIHQNHPLTIGRRIEGRALQLYWEWERESRYRLVGFRDTGGHHPKPYDTNKNGRQIVDTAERAGHTVDRPSSEGTFYYTFYLITEDLHGSDKSRSFQLPDNLLGNLLEEAREELSHIGLVRFSVDLSESDHSGSRATESGQLRTDFEEIIRSFGTKTQAIRKLRERRDEEKEKVRTEHENGEISQEEMEELMEMVEDEYDSARLRIKEDY